MNIGIRRGVISIFIYKEDSMEDLHGHVCIHGGGDVCDVPQVAIDKLAKARVVFYCTTATAAANIEFKVRDAKGVLHVDEHQPGFGRISRGRLNCVLARPVSRFLRTFLIWNPPDRANFVYVEKIRDGKNRCIHFISIRLYALVFFCQVYHHVVDFFA